MNLTKYFVALVLIVCYFSTNPTQGSPVEPVKEKSREHALRFLVLQKSDIVADDADDDEATTPAASEQEDEDDEDDEEDDSAEKTTVPSTAVDGVTARDENEIIDVLKVKDEPAAVAPDSPPAPVVEDDEEKDLNFPVEPEADAAFNETEYVHKPLDITQFPKLTVRDSKVYGNASCQCGVAPPGRIVNGEPAQISEIPWTVGLVRAGFFGFGAGRKPFCGGTLINNRYVATASHCVDGMFASGIKIWLTTEDLNNSTGRVVMDVDSIRMHPGYSRRNVDNDIALIKLASPVSFDPTTSTLAPACIPANNDNDFSTYNATVAGWGTTSSGGPQSTYLRKVTVPVITNEECNRDTMYVDKISDNMLCAGFKEGGKDACQGDSGGPLTIQNSERDTLIGIVSWGYGCAGPNAPGVYTRVGRFPQWILENTSDAEWCSD